MVEETFSERNYSQDDGEVSRLKLQRPYHRAQELDLGIYEIAMTREIRPEFLQNLTHVHKSRYYDIYHGVLTGRKKMDVVVKQCFEDDPISESSIREYGFILSLKNSRFHSQDSIHTGCGKLIVALIICCQMHKIYCL